MDSLKRIKDFFQDFSSAILKEKPRAYAGMCSIKLEEQGISFVYIKRMQTSSELQVATFIPCKPDDYGIVFADLVHKYHLENAACCWLLTEDKYQLIQIEDLPVPPEEFQSAVRWQIKKMLNFPIDDAFIDRFPIPPVQISNPKKYIEIVAAKASYIQPLALLMLERGLNLTTIDIKELALRNVTALFENDEKGTALVYLQEKSSQVLITKQKLFYFARKLDWSLDTLKSKENDVDAAQEYLDKLALELHRSFDYFQGQWREPSPARIFIAPVQATSMDISAYLAQRLTLNIQTLNLNTVIQSKVNLDMATQDKFLSLIGAAIRDEVAYATAD